MANPPGASCRRQCAVQSSCFCFTNSFTNSHAWIPLLLPSCMIKPMPAGLNWGHIARASLVHAVSPEESPGHCAALSLLPPVYPPTHPLSLLLPARAAAAAAIYSLARIQLGNTPKFGHGASSRTLHLERMATKTCVAASFRISAKPSRMDCGTSGFRASGFG